MDLLSRGGNLCLRAVLITCFFYSIRQPEHDINNKRVRNNKFMLDYFVKSRVFIEPKNN